MIGVTLPLDLYIGTDHQAYCALLDAYGGLNTMLDCLRDSGVESIEVHIVTAQTSAETVRGCIDLAAGHGLHTTLHGMLNPDADAFLASYTLLDKPTNITVHALYGEPSRTVSALAAIQEKAAASGIPITLTLENNRHKPHRPDIIDPGDSCESVLAMVSQLTGTGITWDMGHYYHNLCKFRHTPDAVPDAEFLRRVKHTHIHGVVGGTTHYPCTPNNLPLARYIRALGDYKGVYNIELSVSRYYPAIAPRTAFEDSIRTLREVLADA